MGRHTISKRYIFIGLPIFVFTLLIFNSTSNKKRNFTLNENLKAPGNENDISYSQARQDRTVYGIFPKENGFFVEMGAFDGQMWSNTLWLERKHGWTGLLIEADPDLCDKIDKLKRHVWRLCGCISSQKTATFIQGAALGGIEKHLYQNQISLLNFWYKVTVPCFKLDNILDKININKNIDYFSLDVEGAELIVLETMKEDLKSGKIIVDIWTIEYRVWDGNNVVVDESMKNLLAIRHFFKDVGGYIEHSQLSNDDDTRDGMALDVLFVNVQTWCKTREELPNGSKCHV